RRGDVVGRRLVGVGAVGVDVQRAVQAGNVGVGAGRHRRRGVAIGETHANHAATGGKAVRAGHVVGQHAIGGSHLQQRAFGDVVGVGDRRRHVVDDVDGDGAGGRVADAVGDRIGEVFQARDGLGAVICLRVEVVA